MSYLKKYNNKDIVRIICDSAKKYKENLLNNNVIFIFENNKKDKIDYIETIFNEWNFLHLTGMNYSKNAIEFFEDCINKKLSPQNIKIKNKGFTQLKLEILENAMAISKSAKRIGEYNNNKVNITIEKVIGNTHYCLGFSNLDSNNKELDFYYPKTLLRDNLKNNIIHDNRIITILSKNINQELYNEITYISKETTISRLEKIDSVKNLIDFKNIFSQNFNYQEKINEYLESKKITKE